jgi:hypothetical protein
MFDLLMLGLVAIALAACGGYVAWCDRIIGPDPTTPAQDVDVTVRPEPDPARTPKVVTQ